MDDDYMVRATVLADQVRDLSLKLDAHERIEDMDARDRLGIAAQMAYREGMSETEIHAAVDAKLAELEGRTVVTVDADADDAASTKPSAGQDVVQCKACQHCRRDSGGGAACAVTKRDIPDTNAVIRCDDFYRIAPGSRKVGLKGVARGVARAKAGKPSK
jgi:hypothetical protein